MNLRQLPQPLMLAGASARWMAESLKKSGLDVEAADAFQDWDLRRLGPCHELVTIQELPRLVAQRKIKLLVGGGGSERWWGIADQLAAQVDLVAPPFTKLAEIVNPNSWPLPRELQTRWSIPETQWNAPVTPGPWVTKRAVRGGGWQVLPWEPQDPSTICATREFFRLEEASVPVRSSGAAQSLELLNSNYFQRWVPGPVWSANFLTSPEKEHVHNQLLGVCRQWFGRSEWGARLPFQFIGVTGPVSIGQILRNDLLHLADVWARHFGLRGLWGIDFVTCEPGSAVILEINPRPTAALEILEHAGQPGLMARHLQAHGWDVPTQVVAANASQSKQSQSTSWPQRFTVRAECDSNKSYPKIPLPVLPKRFSCDSPPEFWFGKFVRYSPLSSPLMISPGMFSELENFWQEGWLADVPSTCTSIPPGAPIVSILEAGRSESELVRRCEEDRDRLDAWIAAAK